MTSYEIPGVAGYMTLPVLPFLWGRDWSPLEAGFIHSLRPTKVRFTEGEIKSDTVPWRVTVYFAKDTSRIIRIEQEVEVGCSSGAQHGADLHRLAGEQGIKLPEGGILPEKEL